MPSTKPWNALQLLALKRDGHAILASQAERKCDYLCPECGGVLHLRLGEERIPHFYHLNRPKSCRQNGKTLEHLETQLFLQRKHPGALLERRFPEIGRIADVALEEEKIIFEVQVSPISLYEVERRTRDYTRLGYKLFWVFHEKSFDPKSPSPLSRYFRLFSNIDAKGNGTIYEVKPTLQFKFAISSWMSQLLELIV